MCHWKAPNPEIPVDVSWCTNSPADKLEPDELRHVSQLFWAAPLPVHEGPIKRETVVCECS